MEEKLKLIDEISTLVIGLDLDIYLQDEYIYERVCVSDVSSRISDKLFNLKVLIRKDMENKKLPNGFSSWQETHFEVVTYLTQRLDYSGSISNLAREEGGLGRLYELAEDITDEFELKYEGKEWDGDYLDTIDEFLKTKDNHGK
jgi:hypothetical protein